MSDRCLVLSNEGLLDLECVSTFGISVKESDGAIGMFGTGLKYALSILARNEIQTDIWIGEDRWSLQKSPTTVRGKDFDMVEIVSEDGQTLRLGFTTHLGHHWKFWQAFRELYSNMIDEGGFALVHEGEVVVGRENYTSLVIYDERFVELYENRDTIFLSDDRPRIAKSGAVEILQGKSTQVFYRGIRAMELEKSSMYTYNMITADLTEDRTIKNSFMVPHRISSMVAQNIDDEKILTDILRAPDHTLEKGLDFSHVSAPSETFMRVVERHFHDVSEYFNHSARELYAKLTRRKIDSSMGIELDDLQKKMISRATDFLQKLGVNTDYEIIVVKSLGSGVHGMALNEEVFLAESIFDQGVKYIASTIYEEIVHIETGHEDCTRSMQTYLFDRIMTMGERLLGEPV